MTHEKLGDRPEVTGYDLVMVLGEGGMGSVYLGRREHDGLTVAIKFARLDTGQKEHLETRLKRELNIAKELAHPYVVKVIDGGLSPKNELFIVMEYLEGLPLNEIERTHMTPSLLGRTFEQLAEALSYLHSNNLIHRDVKPSNVIITNERAVLVDFGLVKARDLTALTATGDVLGTFAFMAPELLRGETTSPASDVYSVGATLYYVLSGSYPYDNGELVNYCANGHLDKTIPLIELCPDLDKHLADTIMDCLSLDCRVRPKDGEELLSRLSKTSQPFLFERQPPIETASKKRRLLPLALLLLLIVATFLFFGRRREKIKKRPRISRLEVTIMQDELLNSHSVPTTEECRIFGHLLLDSSVTDLDTYPTNAKPELIALVHLAKKCKKTNMSKAVELYSTVIKRHGIDSTEGFHPTIASQLFECTNALDRGSSLQNLLSNAPMQTDLMKFSNVCFRLVINRSSNLMRERKLNELQELAKIFKPLLSKENTSVPLQELLYIYIELLGDMDNKEGRDEICKVIRAYKDNRQILPPGYIPQLLHQAAKKIGGYHGHDFTLKVSEKHYQKALLYLQEALSYAYKNDKKRVFKLTLDLVEHYGRNGKHAASRTLLRKIKPRQLNRLQRYEYHTTCTRLALEKLDFGDALEHIKAAKQAAPTEGCKARAQKLYEQYESMRILAGVKRKAL